MDNFSNLMMIGECLLDVRRTNAFARAIEHTIASSDVALDIGTGSGILAMMAARAGAKRVYAVDIAHDVVHFAKQNITNNNLSSRIHASQADAKHFTTSKPVDVVTMELMDTWLIAEQQAVALNQLRKNNVIGPNTRCIPYRYQCVLSLAEYDFSFYGFSMPFVIQARNFAVRNRITRLLTKRVVYKDIDLQKHIKTKVDEMITLPITYTGRCNALVLEAKIFLSPGISLWGTTDLNMPVIIPIKETHVQKNKSLSVHIRYSMGAGFKAFHASVV